MKKIHLNGPAVTNGGAFVDAGADLAVGDAVDQITADRASALVDAGRARDVTPAVQRPISSAE